MGKGDWDGFVRSGWHGIRVRIRDREINREERNRGINGTKHVAQTQNLLLSDRVVLGRREHIQLPEHSNITTSLPPDYYHEGIPVPIV